MEERSGGEGEDGEEVGTRSVFYLPSRWSSKRNGAVYWMDVHVVEVRAEMRKITNNDSMQASRRLVSH